MSDPDVLIVGGGLAGLCCGLELQQAGLSFQILEASDEVGGRVRTDSMDGFLLDRGFQVLLTAYPEATRVLDYTALELRPFYPGALVRYGGRFHRVADPWRRPWDGLRGALNPIGSLDDKFLVGLLRRKLLAGSVDEIFQRRDIATRQLLREMGFSRSMIERFFQPFIGGVFFDRELAVSRRMFEFGFRMFSLGDTSLPARGMGAIPGQIASRLPKDAFRVETRVERLLQEGVRLSCGEEIKARAVVVATDGPEAARLLGDGKPFGSRSTTTVYFDAERAPVPEPMLILNGAGQGPVNSLCSPSSVAPSYAPSGRSLIAVTIIGIPEGDDGSLDRSLKLHLREWFGSGVDDWRHLRTYRIAHALPHQIPPAEPPTAEGCRVRPGLFVCGEYGTVASLHWAMVSGRLAAQAVVAESKG